MGIFKELLLMVDFWETSEPPTSEPSCPAWLRGLTDPQSVGWRRNKVEAIQGRDIPPKTRPFASHGVWRTLEKIINHCYLRAQLFFFPEVYWLVVLTILKNIGQWEGLSHMLWKKHV